MNKAVKKILIGVVILGVLAFAFWYGGEGAGLRGWNIEKNDSRIETSTDTSDSKDQYMTDPVPEGKPVPVEPQNQKKSDKIYHCTYSISCRSILDNMQYCEEEKKQCVPEDGWILKPVVVEFYEGENVYDVLLRLCKDVYKIHLESSFTPMYNSVYIEGINNIYEFDVGNLSGWMYKVNEWFPNYGASRYELKDGDVVAWEYTCDLGNDIGGGFMAESK